MQVFFSLDGTHVTDPCTTVIDTCVDNYAECNGTICDCISGFIWNGTICGKDCNTVLLVNVITLC